MTATLQRADGAAFVHLARGGLRDLSQRGCAKAMLPRTDAPHPEAVFLNTAGGITGGDRLRYALTLGPGARATASTQTAERAYRSAGGPGRVAVEMRVGPGGRLDWLPQETILFEGSDVARETRVDLEGNAECLALEMVTIGRAAHGEAPRAPRLSDLRRIARDGRPLHEEHLLIDAGALACGRALGPHRALATLVLASPSAADALASVRAALAEAAVAAHASAWNGRLVVRMAAPDPAPLRRALPRAIVALGGRVPRVWQPEAP